jgi:CubicO group peptidase (beta-lactamase class C family)
MLDEVHPPGEPSSAVAVAEQGRVIALVARGRAETTVDRPLLPDSVFYVGSLAKQFTAACIALLMHDDVLGVDQSVRAWIPELPSWGRNVTLAHLMHHTNGWLPAVLTTRGRLNDGSTIDYAWGISARTYRRLPMVSHGGSFPGWTSKLIWLPDHYLAIAWLSNCSSTDVTSLALRAADVFLEGPRAE